MKNYYVYILTNSNNRTLYIGVTNNLTKRFYEHSNKVVQSFTQKYNLNKLVYFESTSNIDEAIEREKTLKKWSRKKKDKLIELQNPLWLDLSNDLY